MGREIYDIINDMAEVLNASQMQMIYIMLRGLAVLFIIIFVMALLKGSIRNFYKSYNEKHFIRR